MIYRFPDDRPSRREVIKNVIIAAIIGALLFLVPFLIGVALTGCGSTKPAPATTVEQAAPPFHAASSGPGSLQKKGSPLAAIADSTTKQAENSSSTGPPRRADYTGFRAGPRYRKDVGAWADAERARQGLAAPPKKLGAGAVYAPANSGSIDNANAFGKQSVIADSGATVLNAPKAEQAALAGAGATITQTQPRTWAWWLLIPAGLAAYGMYRTLKS